MYIYIYMQSYIQVDEKIATYIRAVGRKSLMNADKECLLLLNSPSKATQKN